MLTVDQIRELATRAADGNPNALRVFRDLAATVGITANAGWVTLPGGRRPFAHGWRRAAAAFAASTGWTGKDLLVEMSKRSVAGVDVDAAHDEALAEDAQRFPQELVITFDRVGARRTGPALYYAKVPQPRADRLAAAFERFTLLADSGSTGTSKGLIEAVESATTVTEQQVERAARAMLQRLNPIGLSTPVRVNPHALAGIIATQLEALGFAVVK